MLQEVIYPLTKLALFVLLIQTQYNFKQVLFSKADETWLVNFAFLTVTHPIIDKHR